MKRLLTILALLIAVSAFGDSGGVTARLEAVSTEGTHTNLMFLCSVTLSNQTGATLTATNLFTMSPGLALRVTDAGGHALPKMYAWPMKFWTWKFQVPPGSQSFQVRYLGRFEDLRPVGLSLPADTKKVRLQMVGTLSGSGYTNRLTSNVVEIDVP